MPSVNTIMLIFALAALGILALSALVGFLAGFKRELKLMIVFVVLLGLVWLVLGNVASLLDANLPAFATTMLSDLLSGIFPDVALGEFTSLRGLIVEVAGGLVPDIKNLLVEGTKTYSLIMSVLEFVLRFVLIFVGTIVVYVLFIVIRLLSFVIGSIIRLCTIRRRRRKRKEREAKRETGLDEGVVVVKSDIYDGEVVVTLSRNPKKIRKGKRRGWAAGLGLLRGALTVLLICVPITGLLSIVSEVEPETVDMVMDVMNGGQTSDKMAEGDNDLLDFVFEFAEAYDSGIVAEIIGSSEYFLGKPLDETLFDNLLKIETSTQTIYVREELIKLVKIANILQESYDPDKKIPFDVWSLSDVKQDQIFELLGDFKLFAEIMPVAIEFAGTLDMVKDLFKDSNLDFETEMAKLGTIDWSHDLAYIFKAVRHALELGDITEGFNPLQLNSDVLRDVVANLGATDFVAKLMPIVINVALYLELNPGTENEFKVSDIIGEWPKDHIIVTDGIVWENELVNLVDVYELFQTMELDLSNLDIAAILGDEEKIEIIKNMLTKVVTSDLFLDVLLEIVDVAKEFQLGKLNFEEFKNILKLTNLVAEDWEADVNTLIDMVVIVEELGVLSDEGIDFYNYDALRELVTKLFDLIILSNKAGVNYQTPEQRAVAEAFNEVKTLLVEAALRQFDLFDIEDEFQFEQFTDEERDDIDWENEKQMLLNVLDVYENLMEFLKTKDVTFDNLGDNLMNLLNYDETFDHLIDLLDALVDSDLAMTLIPYALDKYLVPIIEDFEDQAQLPDGDKVDITQGIDRKNLSEEIFNLIYILMDARELGLVGAVTGGELNLTLAALAYNPDSASFNEMSDKLGYRPDADTLALVDIINRVFNSRLFEGKEAKLLRVLFAVFLDTRVSKDAINAIDFNTSEDSERAILVSAINGLRPILEDFNEFFVDGELDFDYFLEKTIALDVIDSARKLFTSEIIAVLLPELYNQYLLPQGMIPEDFAELFNVQSLYLAEHKKDQTYLDGLTGHQLTQDLVTILSIAELLIDFDMLNILASDKDILFAEATDTFNRLFDLIQQLNVLRDNGNKLASILVKMLLEVEIPAEDFEELGINWHEEIEGVKEIVAAVFELLDRSSIDGYKKLNEVLDNPMDYLENFLVDANVKSLADIIVKVSESKVLELVALPLINKFVPGMVEGLTEFTEDEYSGEMVCEDIHAFADILYNIAEAELMATIKVVLGEFTDLLPKSDTNVTIPLRHDLYAEIIEDLFGLNILQVQSVKEYIVKTLSDSLTDMDLSSVTPEGLNFALDGKTIADAYRAFVENFKQDVYRNITVNDVLAIINGEVELKDFEGMFTQANLYAVMDLLEGIISTTLVQEFSLVAFNFVKDMVPEDYAFLFEVEITEAEFHSDLLALMDVVRAAIAQEAYNIIFDKGIPFKGLGNNLRTILETLLNTNLIYKNADNVVMNVLGILDIEVTIEELANVDYSKDLEAIYAIFNHLEDLLTNAKFEDHLAILDFVENLDVNALLEDEEIINNDNLLSVINILDNVFGLTILPVIFEPAYNQYATDLVNGLGEDLKPLLSIDDYKADAFIADAKALVGILREAVNMDALGIYRGGDIDWANTEPIENILKAVFALNFLNAKLDEIVELVSSDSLDLSSLDVEAVRSGLVSDGELLANTYKLLAQNILAKEWFPIQTIEDFNGLGIDSLPFENLLTYEVLETIGKVVYNVVSMNLVYEALPIGFDMAKDMVPENLTFLVDVELGKEELQADLYAIIDILEIVVDIIEPALPELATNVAGIIDGSVDPLQLELAYNLDNLFADVKQIAQLIDNMNLIDGRGSDLIIGALALADIKVSKEELANVSFAVEKDNAELAVAEIIQLLVNNELDSLKDILALTENLSLENTDLINTENVLSILNIVKYVLDSELIRSLFGPIYEAHLKDMVPEDFASVLEFNDEYAARDLLADLSIVVSALQSIVSFEVIEFINAEGEIQWQNIGLVSNGIRQIFSIKLLEAKEAAILDLIAEMAGLTLVDVADINWAQTGEQLGKAIDHIGAALLQAGALNKLADLDTITDNLDAFLTEEIFNEVISALHAIVDASIVEALLPTGINFAAEQLGGKLKTALLMDGLTAADYVADLHSIISILTDLNDMGLPEIVKSIMDNDIESLTWRNTGNLVVIVEKLLQLRFWDNKRFEVIEGILELGGVEVPAELRLLDTAKENQILLDVVREIVVLFDTLFAEDGTASVSSITSFLDTLNDSAVLADVINKALTTISNIYAIEAQSGYIKLLTVPAFNAFLKPITEDFASELFGSANKSIANLDYYGENPEALVNDLLSMSAFFKYIKDSDIVNIALVDGYQIDYGQLMLLGDAFETLFGLELLASKEDAIVDILRGMTDKVELTDGTVDFSNDGTVLKNIVHDLIKFANSGVFVLNSLSDLSNLEIVLENLLGGPDPAIKLVFDALKSIAEISVLDEALAFAHHFIIKQIQMPEGLEFVLELGPNGTPGLVNDYLTIVSGIENIFDLRFTDVLFGNDIKLEFAQVLSQFVESIFELDFLAGKGDKAIEYLANEIGYPELADLLPLDWDEEYQAFEDIFYNLEAALWEAGFFYLSDITDFMGELKSLDQIIDLLDQNVLTNIKTIVKSVAGSIVVQATIGAAAYFALPLVESSLPEVMKPLARLDDITIAELIDDVQSLVAIVADIDNFNLFNAILFGEELIYDADAYLDENLYALQEVFELLFGLNYLNAKLDTIGDILVDMNPQFESIDFDFLQAEAVQQVVYSLRSESLGMSNFAYDGVKLGQMYANLVETVFSDPKWSFYRLEDFGKVQILEDFYSRNIINGILDAFAAILDLNTVQAAIPFVYELLGDMFQDAEFAFIVDYILETPADELQADIVTIISAFKAIADNHEFIYEDDLKEFLKSGDLNKLNFNLSMIEAFPEILDDLSKLNVLNYIKGDRLVEIVQYALDTAMPEFDTTNVNWEALSTLFDYLDENPEELTSFVQVFAILADIVNEDIEYDEFKDLYNDLMNIQISKNEKLLNADVVNSVLDIVDIIVNSTLVESFFYAVYDNFLSETVNGMEPVNKLLDVYSYPSVKELQADLTAFVNIARELVDFDVLGIVFFEREINWNNTTPIENIFKHIFGLNYLDDEAGLPLIINFLSDMVDLSSLDLKSVSDGLASDAELFGLAYRTLATEIFTKEIFPIHSLADFSNIEFLLGDFLTSEILHSAVNAVEYVLSTNLVKEVLEVAYFLGQMNLPDDLYFLVSQPLTDDQLQSDVLDILDIVRELIDAEVYNALLENGKVPFEGIANHLIKVIDLLAHTNIVSADADTFVMGALNLLDVQVSKELLDTVDYEHDLNNLYAILETIETILLRSEFEDHVQLLDFVNNLDLSTILDNEVLINNNNLNYILDILENLVDLSIIPAIFEPVYNKLVDVEAMDSMIQPFLDITEYPAELAVADLKALIFALRNVVDFDALSIVRGHAINWDNIEAIENVITTIFGLNYLNVKLDEIVAYVTENIFDLSDLDVEDINLALDGASIAKAYRILAENVLSQNWFPIQFISDLQSLSIDTLPLDKFLSETVLTAAVDAIEAILSTTLVYEIVPVMYGYSQTIVPDDLFFLVCESLTEDQLHEDVMTIVYILREVIATEFYNVFFDEEMPLAGIDEHVVNVLAAIFGLNLVEGRLNDVFYNVFKLFDIHVDEALIDAANIEGDLDKIYNVIYILGDILENSEFNTHKDVIEFMNGFESNGIKNLTKNEKVLSNDNLLCVLEALENIVSLELLKVIYEPVYNKFVVLEDMPEELQGLLDISEYPADMFVEDLHSIISALRSVVEFDILGSLRGAALNWANIADVENVINQIFGLNLLNVKLDDIVNYVSATIFDLSELDVEEIDLISDGAKIAKAYRMLAENILTQGWFPIQFLSDINTSKLYVRDVLNSEVLNDVVDILEEILTTTIIKEGVEFAYFLGQMNVPDDLYFLVSQPLSAEQLQSDVLDILDILRELIAAEVYNFVLEGEVIPFEGISEHITNILTILFGTNILGNDPINLYVGLLNLVGIEVSRAQLESVDTAADAQVLYSILGHLEDILITMEITNHKEMLDFVSELDVQALLKDEKVINISNVDSVLAILEDVLSLSLIPAIFEPAYNAYVPNMVSGMAEDLQAILSIDDYNANAFIADAKALVYVLRQLVEFGAIGIYYGAEIDWANTEPIENVLETIFALNFLNAKLDEIVTYVSNNMFDLSDLDVEALREKLANDGVILGDVYAILASEVFVLDFFPVHKLEDMNAITFNPGDFLTEDILTSVIDALERLLDLGLVYEALPVAYGYAQTIVPDDLFYLVSNSLTKDQLISDVRVIVPILREVVEAELYKAMLQDQAIPFDGIAEHLITIIDLLVHMNIISTDADAFVIGTLNLFDVQVSKELLDVVDYEHDLNNLYGILETIEKILIKSKLDDHLELLDFVNTLDTSTIINNEDLINNSNLNYIIDIISYLVDLSMVPALYEPLYNKFVVLEDMPEDIQGLLDISEYPAEMFIEDLQSIIVILRNVVDFDALGVYRGNAINWENIEAIENIINSIFGLNYLDVKLDEIVTYVSNNIFDLSDLDVEGINLALDGAKIAKAYRILAENILTENWFPIQFLSDLESIEFDLYYFLDGELLHKVIDAVNEILTTSLVYEALPVLYGKAQTTLPDDLFFLVSNSLTKDELAEDVQSIVLVLREIVNSEIYKAFLNEGVEIEGIADHLVVVLDTIMNTNILGKDLPNVFSGLFNLLGIDLSREELSAVEFDDDFNSIYKVLNIVEDILLNSKFETHLDVLDFMKELNNINAITTNEDILSNTNLTLVLDALSEIVGLDLLLVVFEPVYNKFVVLENMPEDLQGFLDISEYPAEMFIEDLQSLISGLRSVVEFDALGVLRGSAINWSNIEAVENVINQIFGLNYLDVKRDEIVEFVSNKFFNLDGFDYEAIDFVADGAKVAKAYRIIAENILTQSWFPIQFLSDINNAESVLYLADILNEPVLQKVVDAVNEILTTSIVYEVVPVLYDLAQNKLPDSLFFLVSNDLSKDELAEDIQSIVLVLREAISAGAYKVLLNEGIEIEGIADHIAFVIETLLHTNILGSDLPNLFSGVFGLFNVAIEKEVFDAVDFDADLGNIRRALNSIEDILLHAKFETHLDIIDFAKTVNDYTDITKNTEILNNTNLNHLLDALSEIVDLDILLAVFEPVYNTIIVLDNINPTARPFFDISEYPAEMFIEDLQSVIVILRNAVDFDVLGVLRGYEINWENIEAVENVINEIFGLNYLTVKLDEIVDYVHNNFFDLSAIDVEAIRANLTTDGAKIAEAYRIIAENILIQNWFPIQIINDINNFKLDLNEIMTESVLTKLVDALNEILTTTLVYELTASAYDYAQNKVSDSLFFLVAEDLTKDELASDVQAIVAVLREAIAAELYKDIIREGIPLEGLATHVSTILDTLLHTNILGKDYIRLFENIFKLAGLEVDQNDLTYVDFEHDFAQLYAVLENVEDILLNAKYITHLDVLSFMRNMPAFIDIINDNYDLVSDENLHEVLDSLDLLIDLSMVPALYETIYNKFVTLSDYPEKVQPLLDIVNYGADLFVEDAHALVYVLRQLVEFDGLAIYRGGMINWGNTEPIENIITTLFGLNYVDVKLADIINLNPYESINTALINVELLRANLEADGQVFAEVYKNIALDILYRVDFPCQTLNDIKELTRDEIKEFYSKEVALQFIEDVRPAIDTELVGELLVVAYDLVQNKVPAKLQYVVEQALNKEELRSDANDLLDAVKVLIESDLILLAIKRDIPLEGISEPVNELINIAAHTNLIGNDLARFVEGTFALLGMTVSYDDLATVDYEHDLLITYSIVEDIEALLLNCNATTVKGAYNTLKDALASGRAVLRNKELVNEANALSVLDILAKALDLDIARVLAEPVYAKVMNKVVDALGLPAELADTTRYDYNDCINDARIAIQIAREAIAFGAIDYYQDDVLINWSDTTPVKNMITLGFSTEFWNEFDYELIKFVGDKVGFDLVTGIDIESIDWIADSYVFAEAYEIVALGILSDPEFTIQRYSEIWTFDFNIRDYAKQRYALAGIDALDLCVDTTVFDAYGLTVLRFINNYLPESVQFVIDETTISNTELRSDAHTGLYLAELAINEGFTSLVTEKDCDIIKPDFYKEAIKVLFDLNITKDSDVRVRLFNVVLGRFGLEAIDSISDWDNEEQAYLALVDDVCEFLAKNDLTTAKKLYRFLVAKEFISGSFLTDENVLEILDIMDVAISSEVITKVTASVYAKVVEKLPYEGVQNLVGFGTGARDYTKEGFYNDLPLFIEIARDMVNLHMLDVLRHKDWLIASSDEINTLIEKGVSLSLFDGRLDLFADYVFDVLSVTVDLNGIDWDNEIDVLQNVITIVLPALQDSGMIMLSDVKALAREILDAPVAFIKNNRQYANLTNAYVALDALEELGNSEVYMRSVLPLYNRISHKLPAAITDYIDLSTYPEAELRADYPNMLAIVRNGLDGQLYKALTERRGWSFPVEAVTALENIIALACDLNFTARYTEGAIRMVANVLGISNLPSNLDQISLADDKDELVSVVASIREIWIGTNHIRPNIPMLANKDLFVEISFVMDTLLDTTLSTVFVPWTYENYVVRIIEKLPTVGGRIDYSKLLSYTGSEVLALAEDGIIVFNELIAMNVFGMSGIDFTDNSHVITMVDILLKHVGFSARIENYLERLAERSYLMGVIPVSYDQVTSTRSELSVIKGILLDTIDLYRTYGYAILSRDFAKLVDGRCEAMVLAIIDKLGDSVLLNTSFIPLLNGFGDVVIGPEDAILYTACQVTTIPEFKEAVAGLFDILEALEELGFLSKQIKYKDTEGIKELFKLIENSPFVKGQEGILAEFLLRHTDYIDHNDVDLKNINWANEYQYLYEFLDKANAPLNMDGIVITDYKALLDNPVFMNAFTDALRAFAPSELMVEMFMPLFDIASGKYPTIGDLLDYSHLESLDDATYAATIKAEYLSVLDLVVVVSESGIMSDTDLINVNKLLAVYDILFALEGTKNNKADIFEKLSDKLPSFGDSELVIPDDVNWDTEIPAIRGIFASLIHFADVDGNININEISDVISESTDVVAFETLLTAINQSVIYRAQLFDTLNNEINNVSPDGDIVISKYLTDWFKDQEVNGMASISEWDAEMVYLARILTIVNYMRQNSGFTNLGEMNLGKDVLEHAATVSSDEFNVANYGLKQLLQLMSASKSFTLTALNSDLEGLLIDNDEHDGIIKTDKHLAELNDAEWDAEIDDLIRLVHNIQVLELLDDSMPLVDQIKLCTEAEIEELLVSFNHCAAVRDLLPDMISETLDNSDAEEWKSEWLMNQVGVDALGNNLPMASEAEWDYEAKEIAAIISILDTFDFDKEISTYDQDDIDHLRELLHEMNHDKSLDVSYIIEFLNTNVLDKGLINSAKRFETPTTWDMAKWDLELDRMVDVIEVAIENDLFAGDSGNALANMSKDQIQSILDAINNSEIMRTVLPDLVYNAVKSAGQDSWLTEDKWLEQQVGQTAGVNNPVEPIEVWANEIEKYAFIISKSTTIDFENLDLSDNAKLAEIKEVLKAMNETKSFTLDPIVDIINNLLTDKGYNANVIGVIDGANKDSKTDINGSNKDEWATEIDVLFIIVEKMNSLGKIESDSLSSNSQELGELLDQMKVSYLFGNDVRDDANINVDDNIFNALVINVLTTTRLINDGVNGGFIDEDDALEDDWSRYNWTAELAIIDDYKPENANQSDEFIKKAQTSEIIKKYFNIADELNSRIDITFTLLGTDYSLKLLVETANGGPLTNEGLATRVWADELNDVNTLTDVIDSFGGTIENTDLVSFALALAGIRNNSTLAGGVADNILSTVGL